ncbi:MAG: transglycosylase domain-containing protein [Hyphomicrobiales bacterium]
MRFAYWGMVCFMWAFVALIAVAGYVVLAIPNENVYALPKREEGIVLLSDNGEMLARSGSFLGDDARLSDLPPYVSQAVLAIEDRRFYNHFGIDIIGLTRAMYTNVKAGRLVQGGSTLTQQLAKNLFLEPKRTLHRKVQEAILALWLEYNYTKDEIIQLYLNRVYFGAGAYGIEAASRAYYKKSAHELNLAEAAAMAALLKAPSRYNPKVSKKRSRARSKLVLNAMAEQGYIDAIEAKLAIDKPAAVKATNYIPATQYVVDWVRALVPEYTGLKAQGLIVQTTIDVKMQRLAERSLRKRLDKEGRKQRASQGAVVIMSPQGQVRAMVGGRSYKRSQYNRALKASRQPGSAFKPFVYLAAVFRGYQPDTPVLDQKFCINRWCPGNYSNKYYGRIDMKTALAKSSNAVAARLVSEVGPKSVADAAKKLGIRSKLTANATLALGTSEVNLLELVSAYAPFANGGNGVFPHVIKRIVAQDGRILYERQGSGPGRVLNTHEVGAMNIMMAEVVRSGTAKRARIKGHVVAGKTGTTQDYRDAWFIGYSAHYVGGVWIGNDNSAPMRRTTGGGLPAMVWGDVMAKSHAGLPAQALPGKLDDGGFGFTPPELDGDFLGRSGGAITGFFKSIFSGLSAGEPGSGQTGRHVEQPQRQTGGSNWRRAQRAKRRAERRARRLQDR